MFHIFTEALWAFSIATGQLACYVNNELSRFNGHHLAAKFAIFVEDSYFKIIIQINNLLQLQNIQKIDLNIWHLINIIFLVKFCLYVKFTVSLDMLSSLMDIYDSSSQTMVGNRIVIIYLYCLYSLLSVTSINNESRII